MSSREQGVISSANFLRSITGWSCCDARSDFLEGRRS
jgi:hypothetical protein